MYGLEFWHGSQMEEYLGQVCRSRSYVNGQGREVKKCTLGHSVDFWEPAKDETQEYNWQEYDVGCFQSICVFFNLGLHVRSSHIFCQSGNLMYCTCHFGYIWLRSMGYKGIKFTDWQNVEDESSSQSKGTSYYLHGCYFDLRSWHTCKSFERGQNANNVHLAVNFMIAQ